MELNPVYKLTSIRAHDLVDVRGFDKSFFEDLQTITEITAHRIEFKIEKNRLKHPNVADVKLTSLTSATRDGFVQGPQRIRLEAGYDNTPRLIFLGDLRYASNEHDGTQWVTKLQLGDGARAYAEARVNKTFAPGTQIDTILGHLAGRFGVAVPSEITASPELKARIASVDALVGSAADELDRLLAQFGFEWSFQNERLQIARFDAPIPTVRRVISQDSGMIGAPTMKPPRIHAPRKVSHRHGTGSAPKVPELTVKHTLFPELIPGEQFELDSVSLRGEFLIDKLIHEGDNFGRHWTTTIEARSV